MNRILDILIPRFITERVALFEATAGHLEIACAISDVRPSERFDGIATIRSFNLLGFALFPKMVDGPHAWPVQLHPSNKDSADAINLPPCPWCEGPPVVLVARTFSPFGTVRELTTYGCEGLDVDAYVFCHECGCEGPKCEDVIFNAEDFRRVEREGARLWSERTSRNRHLFDSNAADGHCVYPRSAQ
ncbi:Lar family restriction alleviation protein [Pseudomonas aeruginosa]|uniref:Lar family restriction alleviation protein n=1 Tax=Pseudomonas aeruginosa TaxID=287 RepID=UPI001C3CA295|nr:Lar family restriction alleviation protein [Pseudomonas aeruginosa]MBV5680143.1 Lar family restriction alleviation protein [Pseudomonas aeruginosa]